MAIEFLHCPTALSRTIRQMVPRGSCPVQDAYIRCTYYYYETTPARHARLGWREKWRYDALPPYEYSY